MHWVQLTSKSSFRPYTVCYQLSIISLDKQKDTKILYKPKKFSSIIDTIFLFQSHSQVTICSRLQKTKVILVGRFLRLKTGLKGSGFNSSLKNRSPPPNLGNKFVDVVLNIFHGTRFTFTKSTGFMWSCLYLTRKYGIQKLELHFNVNRLGYLPELEGLSLFFF